MTDPYGGAADSGTLLKVALKTPWLAHVRHDDLRFGFEGTGTASLFDLCCALDARGTVLAGDRLSAVQRALKASQNSFVEDVEDILWALAVRAYPSTADAHYRERAAWFMGRRWGTRAGNTDLASICRDLQWTPSRGRELEARMLSALRSRSIASSPVAAILTVSRRSAPLPLATLDERLQSQLGPRGSVRDVITFAKATGCWADVPLIADLDVDGVAVPFVMDERDVPSPASPALDATNWHRLALQTASAHAAQVGGANIHFIASTLRRRAAVPGLDAESLATIVSGHDRTQWLDRPSGWFTVIPAQSGRFDGRLRKLMAVARVPVSVTTIAEALSSDWQVTHRLDLPAPVPPPHALVAALSRCAWLREVSRHAYQPRQTIDPAQVLSEAELDLLMLLDKAGGAAPYHWIANCLSRHLPTTAVRMFAQACPFIHEIERDAFILRGRQVDGQALQRTLDLSRPGSLNHWHDEATDPDHWEFVEASADRIATDSFSLPTKLRSNLGPGRFPVVGSRAVLQLTSDGSIKGLIACVGNNIGDGDLIGLKPVDRAIALIHLPIGPSLSRSRLARAAHAA